MGLTNKRAISPLNGLFCGRVRHQRHQTRQHAFSYQLFMMYCNIDEIDEICALSPFWSHNKRNLASFHDDDYLPQYQGSMRDKVEQALALHHKETACTPNESSPAPSDSAWQGEIYLLANWRYFAYLINPIACFYCFDPQGQLQYLILEVTNTPWGERINYVLECDPKQKHQRLSFDKAMHVSPFYEMDMQYQLNCNTPNKQLSMHLKNLQQNKTVFDASLNLQQRDISAKSLNAILGQYPLMTLKVLVGIYWQAMKIWLKGVPYVSPPVKTENS